MDDVSLEEAQGSKRRFAAWSRKALSVVLAFSLSCAIPPVALAEADDELSDAFDYENAVSALAEGPEQADDSVQEESAPLYEDGAIVIYSFEQLLLVGTGSPVTSLDSDPSSIGLGDAVSDDDGTPLVYALDATYRLASDISVPAGETWMLPEGFSGVFMAADGAAADTEDVLYDEPSDTIYIYNPYQLAVMARADAADQPVLDNDADASQFGMGSPVKTSWGGGINLLFRPFLCHFSEVLV